MKLRHSAEMRDLVASFFPKIALTLTGKATAIGSICSPGELHTAARYLAKALAEYDLRSQKGIADALYTPLDEVYWREDQVIKSAPNDHVLSQKIAVAKELRLQHFKETESPPGGARHAVINAIRHAWLICHEGCRSAT